MLFKFIFIEIKILGIEGFPNKLASLFITGLIYSK